MTTNVVTEYIEGTKGDDEVEVAKTTSATMTTKTMTTTMATMITTKTLIPPLHVFGAEYRLGAELICRAQRPRTDLPRSAAREMHFDWLSRAVRLLTLGVDAKPTTN